MTAPCLSVHDHLDFGVLNMGYDGLWHDTTQPNIYRKMTPLIAVEIGEGFVIGLERTVTSRTEVLVPPTGAGPYTTSTLYTYVQYMLASVTR